MQHVATVLLVKTSTTPHYFTSPLIFLRPLLLCLIHSSRFVLFCFVLWFEFGTAGTKVSESKFVQRCASDGVITGKITGKPASSWEMGNHMDSWGRSSSAWQSSHNSRLIHQMGIMLHTGTTPKKSYTRLAPHLNSLNNSTLLLSTFWICLGREKRQMSRSYWLKKSTNTFVLGRSKGNSFMFCEKCPCSCYLCFLFCCLNNFGIFR